MRTQSLDVSPASGPVAGATSLLLTGRGFRQGSHPQCWLGGGRSNASLTGAPMESEYLWGQSELRCPAPASNTSGHTKLQLSLNGQQASFEVGYSFYATPALVACIPTMVTRTRTASAPSSASWSTRMRLHCKALQMVPTTVVASAPLIERSAPGHGRLGDRTAMHCSERRGVANIDFSASQRTAVRPSLPYELLEAPRVLALEPVNRPGDGDAVIWVHGTGFANRSCWCSRRAHLPIWFAKCESRRRLSRLSSSMPLASWGHGLAQLGLVFGF